MNRKLRTVALAALLALVLGAAPAQADEHDKTRSGHPLRVVAYILYPVGLLLDTLIYRPAHWLGNQKFVKTVFGHED